MPLEALDRVTRLSSRVIRVLGHNPGSFSLQGTNMYLVGAGASRVLIDAGQSKPEDLPTLLRALRDDGGDRVSDVLITHYHHDHTEGIKDLVAHFGASLRVWKLPWAPGILVPWQKVEHGPSFDMAKLGVRMLSDGDVITTEDGDASLRVLATPGHTVDHACFVLEVEDGGGGRETEALFSGDHVLGGSSGVFEDLHSYMTSLDRALTVLPAGGGGRIYPGHGGVITDGHKGVVDYLANRRMREQQVIDVLQGRTYGLTPMGIARLVYPKLSFILTMAAASNVQKTLVKLQKDGQAGCRETRLPFDTNRLCGARVGGLLQLAVLQTWWLEPRTATAAAGGAASSLLLRGVASGVVMAAVALAVAAGRGS